MTTQNDQYISIHGSHNSSPNELHDDIYVTTDDVTHRGDTGSYFDYENDPIPSYTPLLVPEPEGILNTRSNTATTTTLRPISAAKSTIQYTTTMTKYETVRTTT